MKIVKLESLPAHALLCRYVQRGHTDCYVAVLDRPVTHAAYVEAFYTTAVFKLERLLLALLVRRSSNDWQAARLAAGTLDDFAAWHVEARASGQLLMCDFRGGTRTWLMSESTGPAGGTRLYLGSAVVAQVDRASGRMAMSPMFRLLLGFHTLYSRLLLHAACARVRRLHGVDAADR
jgi:hypothetical protein